jgi:hypothetical protein
MESLLDKDMIYEYEYANEVIKEEKKSKSRVAPKYVFIYLLGDTKNNMTRKFLAKSDLLSRKHCCFNIRKNHERKTL